MSQGRAPRHLMAAASGPSQLKHKSVGGPEKRQWVADVVNIVHNVNVTKRLQAIGNSAGIIIDKPILDLLGITAETELELKTDGERLIITPVRDRAQRIAKVQARVVRKHQRTFQKLAK